MPTSDRVTPELDVNFVRSFFPNLNDGWAFFENAGGSDVPKTVIERVTAYMTEMQVQPGGVFESGRRAAEKRDEAQRLVAEMINADEGEVIIGPSTTTNVYVMSHALAPFFEAGDEIIVTNLDHEANSGAWRRLERTGVTVKEWRVNPDSVELEIGDLDALLGERTRLVCFPHCSNVAGGINDVAAITARAHAAGAMVFVDGVAYAPHRAVDVKTLDVDFYAMSFYKVYGPHLAMVYGKRDLLLRCEPQNHFFIGEDRPALRVNAGYPPHESTAALPGIVDYFEAVHSHHFDEPENSLNQRIKRVFSLFAAHEEKISARFLDFLATKPGVRLIGRNNPRAASRAPTFSFLVEGMKSAELPPLAAKNQVAIKNGNFYAYRLMEPLGLDPADGVVRTSMVHYTAMEDVDRLIAALDEIL
ncbi:MAG: cysteine desulfurase-like protein [Rhodospirillales bacterium]|nr:cysteine desulfurase-like protein [Rhodospirillales bacterium]